MCLSQLLKKLNSTERGALFRHFCVSKVITTAHAHKSGVIFHFFQELSNKKKIKALRPKMTKIASRGGPALILQPCDPGRGPTAARISLLRCSDRCRCSSKSCSAVTHTFSSRRLLPAAANLENSPSRTSCCFVSHCSLLSPFFSLAYYSLSLTHTVPPPPPLSLSVSLSLS